MRTWLTLGLSIVVEVIATLALRAGTDHRAWLVVVVAGYVGAFVGLDLVLRWGMSVGVAYGVWSAVGVVLTAVLAALVFGDPLTALMGLGIVLVVAGVLLVETGSHAEPHP